MNFRKTAGLTALLIAIAIPAFAQQPVERPMGPAGRGGLDHEMRPRMLNVEIALRMKDRLKLTEAQVSQLEAVRKEIVAERQTQVRDRIDIESRLRAGLVKPEEIRKQFEGKRDAVRKTVEQRQDRIAKILNQEQQDQVARASHRMLARRMHGGGGGQMGPQMRGKRGHGMRGQMGPGMRGHMGPGMQPGVRRMRPRFEEQNLDWNN
jgi:hypothetical protein